MIGSAPEFAAGLTRTWVRLYTRGLPPDLRAARRAELESDLWEHRRCSTTEGRRPGRIALEIVERLVAGIAADLSWRRLEGRGTRRHTNRQLGGETVIGLLKNNGMAIFTGTLGIACAAAATAGASGKVDGAQVATLFVASLLILGGLLAMHQGVRGGRVAVGLGTIVPGALLVWTIVAPVTSLAILIWLVAGRQPRRVPGPAV